jgi:hypothetical protein
LSREFLGHRAQCRTGGRRHQGIEDKRAAAAKIHDPCVRARATAGLRDRGVNPGSNLLQHAEVICLSPKT